MGGPATQTCTLLDLVESMPQKTGSTVYCRRDGRTRGVPYRQCHSEATSVAAALQRFGIRPGDRVAIHGTTGYEWLLADLGCLLAGAVSVALYPSAPEDRVVGVALESGCKVVFTDSAAVGARLRDEGITVVSLDGTAGGTSIASLIEEHLPFTPCLRGDGPFTIVSTSGTLSEPKLFAVHSAPLLFTMDRFAELYGFDGSDRLLLYLPLSHLPQRMMVYWGLGVGLDFVLSDPAHIVGDSVALAPTLHVAVPRSLEYLYHRAVEAVRKGEAPSSSDAGKLVFGPSCKAVFTGSAPCDPALLEGLRAMGVPVYEVYGTTEAGMIALNTPDAARVGTVGRAIPWGDVRLDGPTSEILVRTPSPFLAGRILDGDIVPEPVDTDAWLQTGDVGDMDADGFITVRGRLRDFVALSNGEKVFVGAIESRAATTTGASVCVLTRISAGHLGALLFFDPADSAAAPDEDMCRALIQEMNESLHPWERVRAFARVHELPSAENGCLTETLKLRRHKIEERHVNSAAWQRVGTW